MEDGEYDIRINVGGDLLDVKRVDDKLICHLWEPMGNLHTEIGTSFSLQRWHLQRMMNLIEEVQ